MSQCVWKAWNNVCHITVLYKVLPFSLYYISSPTQWNTCCREKECRSFLWAYEKALSKILLSKTVTTAIIQLCSSMLFWDIYLKKEENKIIWNFIYIFKKKLWEDMKKKKTKMVVTCGVLEGVCGCREEAERWFFTKWPFAS